MAFMKAGIATVSLFLYCSFLAEASITKDVPPHMMMSPLFNYGQEHGDRLLDDTNNKIELPFNISYFGTSYKTLHVSTDGLLSFDRSFSYMDSVKWWEGVRKSSIDHPFIAPFYYSGFPSHLSDDHQGEILYRIIDAATLNSHDDQHFSEHKTLITYLSSYLPATVVNPPSHFNATVVVIVTWVNVAAKQHDGNIGCTKYTPCPGATFQAVVAANRDTTFVIFNYKNMTIPLEDTFSAGFNGGFNRGWYDVIPCHGKCGLARNLSVINDLPNLKGSDLQGRFILNVGNELIIRGGCLPTDIRAGMLEVFPLEVGMFGGEKLQVSAQCQPPGHIIYCKFGDDQHITKGSMVNELKGMCPVPLMTRIGTVRVYWSSDGTNWSSDNMITVVLPEKVDLSHTISDDVKKSWYSRDAERITIQWDRTKLSSSPDTRLHIKLLGYRELENTVEYKMIEHLGEVRNQDGAFHFDVATHQCKTQCRDYEIGLFEIALPEDFQLDAAERVAIRYGAFPLGWYVNKKLTEEQGSDWSDDLCLEWHDKDSSEKDWHSHLIPCPCNVDQALSDFGRFQPDPSCNLYTGSECHYHTEAKHCVRSIVTTKDGAGNQCCYSSDGNLIYSQLSYQGSTPDRSHVWGAAPYGSPNLIPSLSHWKHDVVSYYYCCLWNENRLCHKYMALRPTADCKKYEPPGIGFLRGDPHITTFDGQTYTFIGSGDFWLVKIAGEVSIQGRFSSSPKAWDIGLQSHFSSWQPRALVSLIIVNEKGGEVIEIHPAPERTVRPHGLDIRVGHTRKFFFNESELWQDFDGYSIVNNALPGQVNKHDNFTVLLNNNIGVNVYGVNGLLHVMVALPPNLKRKNQGLGLLGNFDDVIGNDFMLDNSGFISTNSEKAKINDDFAMSWAVKTGESLFTFSKEAHSSDNQHKYFEVKDIPSHFQEAISSGQASNVCGHNEHCSYDYLITGNIDIARATLAADNAFDYVKGSIYKVDNCGLPEIGRMAELDHYNFSVGHEVRVKDCKEGKYLIKKGATFKCIRERLDEAKEHERDDYGDTKLDPKENVDYIIHWIPRPMEVCTETSEAGIGLYIGIGVGVGVLVIIIIIIIIVCICKRKKSGKASTGNATPTPAGRKKKDPVKDPGAAEAMLDEVTQRSPVYKPSKDAVRMSEVQGHNV